jgi:hypothetical protein
VITGALAGYGTSVLLSGWGGSNCGWPGGVAALPAGAAASAGAGGASAGAFGASTPASIGCAYARAGHITLAMSAVSVTIARRLGVSATQTPRRR